MKFYVFIFVVMISNGSYGDEVYTEQPNSLLTATSADPQDLNDDLEALKNTIQNSTALLWDQIDYYYSCTGFDGDEIQKYFTVNSNHTKDTYLSYTLYENGAVFRTYCGNEDDTGASVYSKLFYRECAKNNVINFLSGSYLMFSGTQKSIDYIQWCIIEEKKESVEIIEFVRFDNPLINIEEYPGLINSCFNKSTGDCKK